MNRKHLLQWVFFALFALLLLYAVLSTAQAQTAATPEFDHSNCQYPNRETNPPNGCDNSDPACPETIKYGYDCQPTSQTPVVEQKPTSQNIETPKKPECSE